MSLGVGENAILNSLKLNALLEALKRISDRIGVSDDVLDEFENILENGGFDLDIAMQFASGE